MRNFEVTVKQLIRKEAGFHRPVTSTDYLVNDLDMDSLDKVELTMMLEGEFGITIDDASTDHWVMVQDVVNHVKRLIPKGEL